MAARFDAVTDQLVGGPDSSTSWAFSVWVYISVDRDSSSSTVAVETTAATNGVYFGSQADGTTMSVFDFGITVGGTAAVVGQWFWAGVTVNGLALTYLTAPVDGGVTSASGTLTSPFTPDRFSLGGDQFNTNWLNGRLAAFKMWNTNLSTADLGEERFQYTPARAANLTRYYPLMSGTDLADRSGNASNLTPGGTATATEDGPPIPVVRPSVQALQLARARSATF